MNANQSLAVPIEDLVGRDARWLRLAVSIAQKSSCDHKHGAILVRGGRLINTGVNRNRNRPELVLLPDHRTGLSEHAEEAVIRKVGPAARGATLYVARVNAQGVIRFSAPCEFCQRTIDRAGISRVVHT